VNDVEMETFKGLPLTFSYKNSLVFAMPGGIDEDGEELNPMLKIVHLKK